MDKLDKTTGKHDLHTAAKTALVTGGSKGIGRGIALALAEAGYRLTISHFGDAEQAEVTAAEVGKLSGVPCAVLEGDLRETRVAETMVEAAVREMGRVDVLINNAGLCLFNEVHELPTDRLDTVLMLNFRAPLILMRDVSRHMVMKGIRGNIVNITSSRAERAYPGDAVYGGLKAGLKRATESAALDLSPYGIRVNCIAPGAIMTAGPNPHYDKLGALIPLGRVGLPSDIGRAAVWLVSEEASYMTGTTMRIDGGLILPGMPEDGESAWGKRT